MKHIIISLILLICVSITFVKGQNASEDLPQVLEKLYGRLVNDFDDNDRLQINDSITLLIEKYVESDTVFNHRFTNLRYLGQITSPDSLLKIITWNLVLSSAPGRYFCYLIRKQKPGEKNRIYKLTTSYDEKQVVGDTEYTESNWYGALYYDIKPIVTNNNRFWMLLGIDYGNPFITRKIIEVLSFSTEDSIIFGKKWFDKGQEIRYRHVFEYASNGMMSLRFGSDSSIVFDHLVPFSPAYKDDPQYYGPDYSNDAYYFKNGIWKFTINVDARNKE